MVPPERVALRVDGAPLFAGPAAQVFLSNLPFFGFGFHVDPFADPSDGILEAIVLESATRRGIVGPSRPRATDAISGARASRGAGRPRALDQPLAARRRRPAARRHHRRSHRRPRALRWSRRRRGHERTSPLTLRRPAPGAVASALWAFSAVAVALGAARAMTTTYVPVLLERIADRPGLIGAVMLVNAVAGFVVPLATGLWSDRRGTRGPFIIGGAVVAAGGLVAVALGTTSSYVVLALAAATVYVGLNAARPRIAP